MSDNIPFDIQIEIIKKVSNVKSLIQFRSVSKQWKSFIDSSDFIKGYGARYTNPHSHILCYRSNGYYRDVDLSYICLVDDDIETFEVQQQSVAPFVVSPSMKQYSIKCVIGASHGLLCLYGCNKDFKHSLVIWNPSIGKSFCIVVPCYDPKTFDGTSYGFGVCPVTSDPTVVKFVYADNMPWHVEVFTLSLRVWHVIPSGNLPRQTVRLTMSTQVVIDKFIYWGAWEWTNTFYGECSKIRMVVSFDMITHEFKVVNLSDTLKRVSRTISVSELRGSLVVCGYQTDEAGVWVMENDSTFSKLFTIRAPRLSIILGFKKNEETIFKIRNGGGGFIDVVDVYDPSSQQIKNLGISGVPSSFFMGSYTESLLLLDHLDSRISYDKN